jgi:hypothetical protein
MDEREGGYGGDDRSDMSRRVTGARLPETVKSFEDASRPGVFTRRGRNSSVSSYLVG